MLKRYILAVLVTSFSASYGMEKEPAKSAYLEDARKLSHEHELYFSVLPKDILGIVQHYRLHELLDKASRAKTYSEASSTTKGLAQLPEYTQVFSNPNFIDGVINRISKIFNVDPEIVARDINTQGASLWLTQIRSDQVKLLEAASEGYVAMVQQLIAQGVNVNARSNTGWTALMYAADYGRAEIVKILIGAGANVNAQTPYGSTALMYAAKTGHTEIVKELIGSGADVTAQNKDKQTALDYAQNQNNKEMIELLKKAANN